MAYLSVWSNPSYLTTYQQSQSLNRKRIINCDIVPHKSPAIGTSISQAEKNVPAYFPMPYLRYWSNRIAVVVMWLAKLYYSGFESTGAYFFTCFEQSSLFANKISKTISRILSKTNLMSFHVYRSQCQKHFLEEIEISPKLRNWKKFVLMSEPAQKCKKCYF